MKYGLVIIRTEIVMANVAKKNSTKNLHAKVTKVTTKKITSEEKVKSFQLVSRIYSCIFLFITYHIGKN